MGHTADLVADLSCAYGLATLGQDEGTNVTDRQGAPSKSAAMQRGRGHAAADDNEEQEEAMGRAGGKAALV